MSNEKVIIWDFEGTLGIRPGGWSQALAEILRADDPASALPAEQLYPFLRGGFPWHHPERSHTHMTTPQAWWGEIERHLTQVYSTVGLSRVQAERLARLTHQYYLDTSRWIRYPDVLSALAAVQKQGWEQVILSNHIPELDRVVDALGLTPYIRTVISSALAGYEKPHPRAFLQLVEHLDTPKTLWMIGDNLEVDILGAQAVGIPGILVRKTDTRATRWCADLSCIPLLLTADWA